MDEDPTSPWWLARVTPFLIDGASPAVTKPYGRLIWDLSWPVRDDSQAVDWIGQP